MRKVLTGLQALCGFVIYGAIGACDNGGDFGTAVRVIFISGSAIALFGGIKKLITALGRAIDERSKVHIYSSKHEGKCQGGI